MRPPAWLVGFPLPGRKGQSGLKMSMFQVISSVYYILSWIPLCLCASPPVQSTKKLIAVICKKYIQCLNTCKSWRWVWNTASLPWHLTRTFAFLLYTIRLLTIQLFSVQSRKGDYLYACLLAPHTIFIPVFIMFYLVIIENHSLCKQTTFIVRLVLRRAQHDSTWK